MGSAIKIPEYRFEMQGSHFLTDALRDARQDVIKLMEAEIHKAMMSPGRRRYGIINTGGA